jgi:hypothetical protein
MKRRGGRFGKYGEVKRKTRLRGARLSHLEGTQPGLAPERRRRRKRTKPWEEK